MNTPICDFIESYTRAEPIRLHMPGHKGKIPGDITEIHGTEGLIRASEENAADLFGSVRTVYSAEGSSLGIRAMVYLVRMYAQITGRRAKIAAGRNAHRVFLEAAALLDVEICWLGADDALLSGTVTPAALECFVSEQGAPTAVYVTSPDYLGHCTELESLAEICHRYGTLLLVDNAHGAYLKFLQESRHPMDCGADLCCDSAHKTLPVLTGGAYLHASKKCPGVLIPIMERAMALFASTSPSWLILQSLDRCNALLAGGDYPARIRKTGAMLTCLKHALQENGWTLFGEEALKLCIRPKSRGYTGQELALLLEKQGMFCEFSDPDHLVIMVTPETAEPGLESLQSFLTALPKQVPILTEAPRLSRPRQIISPQEALFAPFKQVPVEESVGRILASPSISCPPAVPICVCGERIDENALRLFRYYGITHCDVIIEKR